jgi:hypothetical protein
MLYPFELRALNNLQTTKICGVSYSVSRFKQRVRPAFQWIVCPFAHDQGLFCHIR